MDSSSDNNMQRNNNRESSNDDKIDSAIARIFKDMVKYDNYKVDINNLINQIGNPELAVKVQKIWMERFSHINKKAKKFAQLIRNKYSNSRLPFHLILEKARLFKKKYSLSDDEFVQFQRIYEQELIGLKSHEVLAPVTNMMKVLGNVTTELKGIGQFQLNDQDAKVMQDILKLYASSKSLHAQVFLQSIQYNDCAFEAVSGNYERNMGHRPGDSIHPIIAALFLPKFEVIDNHFIHSNIASIVKCRQNGETFTTKADYELFYSLVNDPNDIICDNKSIITDLYNRAQIQNQLWEAVLSLRNGQYYGKQFRDFIGSIDMCKLNKYDTPDLIYGRNDGTVLKRLISAFSFRPTIVSTFPVYTSPIINMNPYQQNMKPVVTSISMINLKVPPVITEDTEINLNDALNSSQLFLENGAITPRATSIIYSRGVLIFYVDRRTNIIHTQDMQPFNITRLPRTVSGFERLNPRKVDFNPVIHIREDIYCLRSVVIAELSNSVLEPSIVIGSSTIFMKHANNDMIVDNFLRYSPLKVVDNVSSPLQTGFNFQDPVTSIDNHSYDIDLSFTDLAKERGIVFIYELQKDSTKGEVNY